MASIDCDVVIVGAGAAGLAAAHTLRRRRLSYLLLEASSRIGGRARTDFLLPGCPIDLGCHYLHSASINPFTKIARRYGFTLQTAAQPQYYYRDNHILPPQERERYGRFFRRCRQKFTRAAEENHDVSLSEMITHNAPFAPFYKYYASLQHSKDAEEVSVFDAVLYNDTGEDWLIKDGFGALLARFGRDIPVSLNCPVAAIDWGGKTVRVRTAKGDIRAAAAIITASTGALDKIHFSPSLPPAKQSAIAALPMGNYNHFYGALENQVLSENARGFDALQFAAGREMYFHVRPFGMPYIEAAVAGRTASALERTSIAAQRDFFINACQHTFGGEVAKNIGRFVASGWRKNRWVRGGYAATRPGCNGSREELARPLSEMLYFAGEATSSDSYNTAHGAYLSGRHAALQLKPARQKINASPS